MGYPAVVIPEKIFSKIGEVCDLVGVQAHVLRYWETEFPCFPRKKSFGKGLIAAATSKSPAH